MMTAGTTVRLLALTAALGVVTTVSAQSLGELAKQEEARRSAIKSSGKVYTNDSIRPEPASARPLTTPAPAADSPAPGTASGAPAAEATAPSTPAASGAQAGDAGKKDEAYWKKRILAARDGLERSQTFADALQSRINALTADFTARDDPAQRAVIGANRQKALAELDRVKQDIQQNTKAITAIQEEARRAGVPPGWLR